MTSDEATRSWELIPMAWEASRTSCGLRRRPSERAPDRGWRLLTRRPAASRSGNELFPWRGEGTRTSCVRRIRGVLIPIVGEATPRTGPFRSCDEAPTQNPEEPEREVELGLHSRRNTYAG
jgi:hypothetical protein